MKNILKNVILDYCNKKRDNTVVLKFITNLEQTDDEYFDMFQTRMQSGALYFKPNGILNEEEVKAIDKADIKPNGKSKGQQLRGAIWATWKAATEAGKTELTQEAFYNSRMEKYKSMAREEREMLK
jgi:hypothetical protein|tara:strand:+ start:2457 stop:2834 length:378 start_codon:yes stop_codon:yes gene_type:complete